MTKECEFKGGLTSLLEKNSKSLDSHYEYNVSKRANHIFDYIMCYYPFIYVNLKMISSSDRDIIADNPTITSLFKQWIRNMMAKVLVDDEVVEFFIDINPNFFDGLTLIDEDDLHKPDLLDECLRKY
jgi:hypothetical protein